MSHGPPLSDSSSGSGHEHKQAFTHTGEKHMRASIVTAAAAAFLTLGATVFIPAVGARPVSNGEGRLLLQHEVSKYAAERGPLDGAPGADAIGFRVSDSVQGGVFFVGLDQPVLGVFVGLNIPNQFINEPYNALHVTFTLADGSTRTVKAAGGGGTAMLFQSPEDVPMSSLRMASLYVDEAAEWAK
jgi:hypothetical protein